MLAAVWICAVSFGVDPVVHRRGGGAKGPR